MHLVSLPLPLSLCLSFSSPTPGVARPGEEKQPCSTLSQHLQLRFGVAFLTPFAPDSHFRDSWHWCCSHFGRGGRVTAVSLRGHIPVPPGTSMGLQITAVSGCPCVRFESHATLQHVQPSPCLTSRLVTPGCDEVKHICIASTQLLCNRCSFLPSSRSLPLPPSLSPLCSLL